jgi:hypothetical protein
MDKMSLIVFKDSGHVLGAFTRTVDPEGAIAAQQVAGDAIVVRDPDTGDDLFHVSSARLAIQTIDRRDDAILLYRQFVFKDGLAAEMPAITAAGATYAAGVLNVTLDNNVTGNTKVWVQLEAADQTPILVAVDIPDGLNSGDATVTLTPGVTYDVLVLAPGYRAHVQQIAA